MLTVNPKHRITIKELLVHPWLNKNYQQALKWNTIYNVGLWSKTHLGNFFICFEIHRWDTVSLLPTTTLSDHKFAAHHLSECLWNKKCKKCFVLICCSWLSKCYNPATSFLNLFTINSNSVMVTLVVWMCSVGEGGLQQ